MHRATLVVVILAIAGGPALADPPSAREILRDAVAAHGGTDALGDYPHLELKGTYENPRRPGRRSDLVRRERADGAYREEVTFEFRGRKMTPVEFYDGHARKRRFRSGWDDLPVDEAVEEVGHRLPWLLTLRPDDATVEGEAEVGGVPTWRLSVPDGRGRAVLDLARDDGRLVALEYPGTSAAGMGTKEEVSRRLVFRDHRRVGDLLLPFEVEIAEDGSPVAHLRWTSIRELETFDEEWIRVPDPSRRFIPGEELAF